MAEYVWVDHERVWKMWSEASAQWIRASPPKPEWAQHSDGPVPAARFIRIWSQAETIEEVQSQLFWLSTEEIETQRERLSTWLSKKGIQPLTSLPDRFETPLTPRELTQLLAEGALRPLGAPADEAAALNEEPAEAVAPTAVEVEENQADEEDEDDPLTPTPPRPDEDPFRGKVVTQNIQIHTMERGFTKKMFVKY